MSPQPLIQSPGNGKRLIEDPGSPDEDQLLKDLFAYLVSLVFFNPP
jgi:hypothetical protein